MASTTLRSVFLIAASLTLLPSCGATRALWDLDHEPKVHVDTQTVDGAGKIHIDPVTFRATLVHDEQSWELRPSGAWATEALGLLAHGDLIELESVAFSGFTYTVDGETRNAGGRLSMRGSPAPAAHWLRTIGSDELPDDVRYLLESGITPDVGAHEPMVRCRRSLQFMTTNGRSPWTPGDVRIAAVVFTNEAGPVVAPGQATLDSSIGTAERKHRLDGITMYASLECGEQTEFVRIDPFTLWLVSMLQPDDHGVKHTSRWELVAADTAPPTDRAIVSTELDVEQRSYEKANRHWLIPLQVLATPATLVADAVLLPVLLLAPKP